jgi:hypothetical protein
MKKITKKVILNTTKDSLNDIVDQLQIDPNKKTKKVIEKLAERFSVLMKNEIIKQTKKKLKSAKSYIKSKKVKKVVPVQ